MSCNTILFVCHNKMDNCPWSVKDTYYGICSENNYVYCQTIYKSVVMIFWQNWLCISQLTDMSTHHFNWLYYVAGNATFRLQTCHTANIISTEHLSCSANIFFSHSEKSRHKLCCLWHFLSFHCPHCTVGEI